VYEHDMARLAKDVAASGSAKHILKMMAQPGTLDQFINLNPPRQFFCEKYEIADFHSFQGQILVFSTRRQLMVPLVAAVNSVAAPTHLRPKPSLQPWNPETTLYPRITQVYEDDMARLTKDVAAARAGESASATDAAAARLQLATALRREEGAGAAAGPPSGASHAVLLKAAAESSDRSARALADLKQQLKKTAARAASAEGALEGERRRCRALLLRAKQVQVSSCHH
jgi:hypothetical protein